MPAVLSAIFPAFVFAMTLLLSSFGQAQQTELTLEDVYKYQVQGGFPLKESCRVDGEQALSTIKVYIDPKQSASLNLVDAYVKVRVCTVLGGMVKDALPLVIPVQAIQENLSAKVGSVSAYPFAPNRMASHFPAGSAPDTVILKRIKGSDRENIWFELTLVQSRTNTVKVGPVRFAMTTPQQVSGVIGFDPTTHVPLRKIEIDVPQKNVTIRADLRRVEQEMN